MGQPNLFYTWLKKKKKTFSKSDEVFHTFGGYEKRTNTWTISQQNHKRNTELPLFVVQQMQCLDNSYTLLGHPDIASMTGQEHSLVTVWPQLKFRTEIWNHQVYLVMCHLTTLSTTKYYTALVVDNWMSMKRWRNDTDGQNLQYSHKNLSQCHFIHHKLHMHLPGIESKLPMCEADG